MRRWNGSPLTELPWGHTDVVARNLRNEPGIEKMQNGMVYPTNVEIHGHAFGCSTRFDELVLILGSQEPEEIPGRIHKGVHSISLALSLCTTFLDRGSSSIPRLQPKGCLWVVLKR